MKTLSETVQKLSEASRRDAHDLADVLEWPEKLSQEEWFMGPELVSIYGTEAFANLTEDRQKILSFFECVNLFSMNIHGERMLIEGIAKRLYKPNTAEVAPYLHHFLDEENKHLSYFGGFCMRYANKVYPSKHLSLPRQYAKGEEDFLFFAKVFIFEEMIDDYNVRIMVDQRVNQLARRINYLHHKDEARHLAFGRKIVLHLFERYVTEWSEEELAGVREHLGIYLSTLFKEFFNPSVYKDAGMLAPYELAATSFAHPSSRQHRQSMADPCIQFLLKNGILAEAICV